MKFHFNEKNLFVHRCGMVSRVNTVSRKRRYTVRLEVIQLGDSSMPTVVAIGDLYNIRKADGRWSDWQPLHALDVVREITP